MLDLQACLLGSLWLLVCGGCGARTQAPCPAGMVYIPAGTVELGMRRPDAAWHRPARTVALDGYCVDAFEHPNIAGVRPTALVTFDEAAALCAAAGKRPCTGDE